MLGRAKKRLTKHFGADANGEDDSSDAKRDAYESYMRRAQKKDSNQCVDVADYVEALISEKSTLNRRCLEVTTKYNRLQAHIHDVVETLPGRATTDGDSTGQETIGSLVEKIQQDFFDVIEQRDKLGREHEELRIRYGQLSRDMKAKILNLQGALDANKQIHEQSLKAKEKEKTEIIRNHDEDLKELRNANSEERAKEKKKHAEEKAEDHNRYQDLELRLLNGADGFQPKSDTEFDSDIKTVKQEITGVVHALKATRSSLCALVGQRSFVESDGSDRQAKLALECALWKVLCDRLFSTPFRVFGDYGDGLFTTWCEMFLTGGGGQATGQRWPAPTTLSERWRHNTIRSLSEASQPGHSTSRGSLTIRSSYEKNLEAIQNEMAAGIQKGSSDGSAHEFSIKRIVDLAAKLALDCFLQQCRIQLLDFAVGHKFNQTTKSEMLDRNAWNSSGITEGVVSLFIAPGLQRIGDGRGGSMDLPPFTLSVADVFLVSEG
ncbi:hypothetical protein P154DRAFT_625035 [Amniculicola lignicola CBS 123094]|uniref:Uncharacterized protein n=1 Tax=Amniculicola lignicola CBS 123094 TaxID=1392246 RepID=A0A6A5W1E1_9PLEO|nr:hypothetical protein P154DRAFT_625035 [Amniculicola lignicola CBS 123094]